MTCYVGEGELICEDCAVDMSDDEMAIGGETDSPPHCAYCHRPLGDDFELTSEGKAYVMQAIRDALKRGTRNAPNGHLEGYYAGTGPHAVLRDWVDLWLDRGLYRADKRDRRTVELFMHWTRGEAS